MVHWIHMPIALALDQTSDKNGIFTGSTTTVHSMSIIICTGIPDTHKQVQYQAIQANLSDPKLTNWTKSPLNPLITDPNGGDLSTAFHDDENNYYLIYGDGTDDLGAQSVLFTPKDMLNWTCLYPMYSNHYDKFWKCPDIFNITNRIVLKNSLLGYNFWIIGTIDTEQLIFTTINYDLDEFIQLIDHREFYSSKTAYEQINDQ